MPAALLWPQRGQRGNAVRMMRPWRAPYAGLTDRRCDHVVQRALYRAFIHVAIWSGTRFIGRRVGQQRCDGCDVGEQRVSAEPEVVEHAPHGWLVPAATCVGH